MTKSTLREYEKFLKNPVVPRISVDPLVKAHLILEYGKKYGVDTLIETGTADGNMLTLVESGFEKIYSFELMESYYTVARNKLSGLSKVRLFNASSVSSEFRSLVRDLQGPALFYLDAHFSGEGTGQDTNLETPDVPVRQELEIIMQSPHQHVIIVDDARCFSGEEWHTDEFTQYPTREELASIVSPKYALSREIDAFIIEVAE